ncbi:hypothetical protein ThidrDRAFT_3223 [Thiorhodococcus drewsii AZ1]|uniref:DUF3150 domain-containing protein n=1 Tax=Thiorhodococcus drewsii AZ1 TaxID=765913 RepID=G2E4L0_9GAMM|nr:DUF3150 domain-containing protein [Thiorhodococcus drewsii]EGV29631.1 hypothetical protein ThidrDRAFT_3223 [Thiorhodococcus drewsii AZ1]
MTTTTLDDTLITLTERLSLIVLTVSTWSGRKKLRADDLGLQAGEIPSEELVSLGSKRLCNPDAIRVFHTLKGQAERACLKVGTRFLGGYLVPNDQVDGLCCVLDGLKRDFEHEVQSFLAEYDREIADWIARHPDWERQLRAAVDPAEVIGTRFSFRYRPLVIQPADGHRETLTEDVAEIGHTIFHEVAQIAVSLEKSLVGKDSLTQRALGTFRRIQEKLAVLSFIDPRIQPILELVEGFLSRVPRRGPISGALFQEGFGLWLLLCDEERLTRHGAGRLAGDVDPDSDPPERDSDVDAQRTEAERTPRLDLDDDSELTTETDVPVTESVSSRKPAMSHDIDVPDANADVPLDCFF